MFCGCDLLFLGGYLCFVFGICVFVICGLALLIVVFLAYCNSLFIVAFCTSGPLYKTAYRQTHNHMNPFGNLHGGRTHFIPTITTHSHVARALYLSVLHIHP